MDTFVVDYTFYFMYIAAQIIHYIGAYILSNCKNR